MTMQIPENNDKTPKPTFVTGKRSIPKPVTKPTYAPGNKREIPEDDYRQAALKKRLSPHEQHVRHMNHVNHVQYLKNQGNS